MVDSPGSNAALFDFVEQWIEDCRSGGSRPLREYLERFPGEEQAIAREYLRLSGSNDLSAARIPLTGPRRERNGLTAHLSGPRSTHERYEPTVELARGGMGLIVRARDRDLLREVAMKVMLGRGPRQVARFLEEAQVTGQLDHPGVVPVHDLGVDADGRVFFTMRLVEGRDLREVIDLARSRSQGWSIPRALEVLLKVCDTVAFAHARGVVHRDLKPSNVRVGGFGEVYVMDWGLALVRGGGAPDSGPGAIDSGRATMRSLEGDSPLLTQEGDILGTPSYMAPEQADGRTREVGPTADVYAVGAMLYQLLSGVPPFGGGEAGASSEVVLERVRRGPPESLLGKGSDASPELVAICEKAMARQPGDRYPSLREMAEDLRAFLEGRVVRAHRTGAWVELAKWVARNRALAASLAGAVALALVLLTAVAVLGSKSRGRLELLADAHAPSALLARTQEIASSGPEQIAALERWIFEARDLVSRRGEYARQLEELRTRALPFDAEDPRERNARQHTLELIRDIRRVRDFYRREVARLERVGGLSNELLTPEATRAKLESLERRYRETELAPQERVAWTFSDPEDQLRFDTLQALVPALAPFLDSPGSEGLIRRMERRLEFAQSVEARTLVEARDAWERAIASIGDPRASPRYGGLAIRPQLGLVPLRQDPESGLWEFLHLQSGSAPAVGEDGRWRLSADTGIVLVLLPGGEFLMGAQRDDPSGRNYDPQAEPDESAWIEKARRPFPGELLPFFLSKYEVTQAQWRRLSGASPSRSAPPAQEEPELAGLHPVEGVDWTDARQVLLEVGLELPSEARWEYAARAGTTSPWWTGAERDSLRGAANLADARSAGSGEISPRDRADPVDFDDGFASHGPVGSFRPNPFGLFDVCGNVSEWCSDSGFVSYDYFSESHYGDLERLIWPEGLRIRRGGSFATRAMLARSSARAFSGPRDVRSDTGVRPARDVD